MNKFYAVENASCAEQEKLIVKCAEDVVKNYKGEGKYQDFFVKLAQTILTNHEYMELNASGEYRKLDLSELKKWNDRLFGQLYENNYANCWANPEYAVNELGETGSMLSAVYYMIAGLTVSAASEKRFTLAAVETLFVKLYELCVENKLTAENIKNLIAKERLENIMPVIVRSLIKEQYNPDWTYFTDIVNTSDFNDVRYLYWYGCNVTDNEIKTAQFLNSLTLKEVQSMADTFTEGFLVGYAKLNKDIHNKKSVALYYKLGFERFEKCVVENFKKEGIKCVSFEGYADSTSANRQADYDHKDDEALYLTKEYLDSYMKIYKDAYESEKANANGYAGPMALEPYGEKEFNPVSKKESLSLSEEQQELSVERMNQCAAVRSSYVFPEERSFSIISYPVPDIGDNFKEVFAETVKVNTLDYKTYENIQQKLIDVLDKADYVRVKGSGKNKTELTVKTVELKNPAKESAFENCVADVNIPVGEVFTSPVLKGTNGMLNVSKVYLNGMLVKDLELVLKDGMISSITCSNFDNAEDNKKYLDDVIMFHHETLPIGEFAIGTNTTAYKMGIEYNIQDKLPILIAEKTGPHFAMGDTCYSRSEDIAVFNPDGKEIVAKENDVSRLRSTDPSKAYMNCHTDITIPYNELDYIEAVCKDGSVIRLIDKGRFVLPGTEELNVPLDELESLSK